MRRLFWQMSVTLDGFMEGPNHALDDTAGFKDEDFDRYATEMLNVFVKRDDRWLCVLTHLTPAADRK